MHADYWQSEKDKLALALQERILASQDWVRLTELEAARLPGMLLASLQKMARDIFNRERPIRIQSTRRCDFATPEITAELKKLKSLLLQHVLLRADEVIEAIRFYVSMQFDLITRPNATIKSLLYQERSEIPVEELLEILSDMRGRSRFIEALSQRVANIANPILARQEFDSILNEVKEASYSQNPVPTLLADLDALQEFYQAVYEQPVERFSAELLYYMLTERGMLEFAENFKEEQLANQPEWEVSDFRTFIERHLLVGQLHPLESDDSDDEFDIAGDDVEEPEPAPNPPRDSEAGNLRQRTRTLMAANPERNQTEEENPVARSFKRIFFWERSKENEDDAIGPEPESAPATTTDDGAEAKPHPHAASIDMAPEADQPQEAPVRTEDEDDKPAAPQIDADDLLHTEDEDEAEPEVEGAPAGQAETSPYPPFRSLIDERSRQQFIDRIFAHNTGHYTAFLNTVEKKESWREAKSYLDAELERRGVSPYSREAVKLSDLLFARYFSKGQF